MHGLDYYDYSARMYDATLGRFTTVDPMVEKYYSMSPYAYCANNPVNFIDLDGRAWRPTFDMDHNGTRTYNGYEWIPNEQSYDKMVTFWLVYIHKLFSFPIMVLLILQVITI